MRVGDCSIRVSRSSQNLQKGFLKPPLYAPAIEGSSCHECLISLALKYYIWSG